MVRKSKVAIIFLALSLFASGQLWGGVSDDIAPCVIFLIRHIPGDREPRFGSGFLLRKGEAPFIVTAGHVAIALGEDFQIVMPGADGRPVTARMQNTKWHVSTSSDVALARIKAINPRHIKVLIKRCLPENFLTARPLPPSRDISLTVMGYPLGLGAKDFVSPISIETRAASGFITLPRFDNMRKATFILLQDPSIGGLSGGPVFDTGKGYFEGGSMTVRSGVSVVGLVHGVISDKTGGKFAAVVPSTEISALLQLQVAPSQE